LFSHSKLEKSLYLYICYKTLVLSSEKTLAIFFYNWYQLFHGRDQVDQVTIESLCLGCYTLN